MIKIDVEDGGLRCERQAEYGYDTVQVELPAVISVGDAINEPRYPSLKAIMGAKKKPLETKSAADAGIEADRVGFEHARAHCSDFARSSETPSPTTTACASAPMSLARFAASETAPSEFLLNSPS